VENEDDDDNKDEDEDDNDKLVKPSSLLSLPPSSSKP
jgi:hypothetical protein